MPAPSDTAICTLSSLLSSPSYVVTSSSGAEAWRDANYRWSAVASPKILPSVVAFPSSPEAVSICLKWAKETNVQVAVKCGGHATNTAASISEGLVIDMKLFKKVQIAEDKKSVRVGGGCLWDDVYTFTDANSVAVVGGGVWNVGVGGFCTGAGYAWLSGLYGLAVDNVIGAQVVLADGRVVECAEGGEEEELLWSIRGGSSNFGVITAFTLRAFPHPGLALSGAIIYNASDLRKVFSLIKQFLKVRKATESLVMTFARDPRNGEPNVVIAPWIVCKDVEDAKTNSSLAPFFKEVTPLHDFSFPAPGFVQVGHGADAVLMGGPKRKMNTASLWKEETFCQGDFVMGAWEKWVKFSEAEDFKGSQIHFEMHDPKVVANNPRSATSYHAAGRVPHFYSVFLTRFDDPANDSASLSWTSEMRAFAESCQKKYGGGTLGISGNSSQGEVETIEEIYGPNLERLRRNKEKYDPERVFNRWFPITKAERCE